MADLTKNDIKLINKSNYSSKQGKSETQLPFTGRRELRELKACEKKNRFNRYKIDYLFTSEILPKEINKSAAHGD